MLAKWGGGICHLIHAPLASVKLMTLHQQIFILKH